MALYDAIDKTGPQNVEAIQWFKNGDHPHDQCETYTTPGGIQFLGEGWIVRYFRHPAIPGHYICNECNKPMDGHGWIDYARVYGIRKRMIVGDVYDGEKVCPGNWIFKDGEAYVVLSDRVFKSAYVPAGTTSKARCVPCPFCGHIEPEDYTVEFMEMDDKEYFYVTCVECGAEGPPAEGDAVGAAEAWEKRT